MIFKDKVNSTNQIAQSYNDGIIRIVAYGNNNSFAVGFSQRSREIQSKLSNNKNQTAEKFLAYNGLQTKINTQFKTQLEALKKYVRY